MPYRIEFAPEAVRALEKTDRQIARRIKRKILWLSENADQAEHVALREPLAGKFKLRQGDYRVIYELDKERRRITIRFIGHRSLIYKIK